MFTLIPVHCQLLISVGAQSMCCLLFIDGPPFASLFPRGTVTTGARIQRFEMGNWEKIKRAKATDLYSGVEIC